MSVRIIKGDVREKLAELPADYFDCIVTSPPYYGLRDYGYDAQIGLEPTLDGYLETMVAVCRDLRRVLKPSAVFFLNIGDSYNNRTKIRTTSHQPSLNNFVDDNWKERAAKNRRSVRMSDAGELIKEKDLMLVPERLGIALQADGWWVRSRIIWHKPNPMPESVTDRPTSAHETIWMLTKRANYFWDGEAVREPYVRLWDESNGGNMAPNGVHKRNDGYSELGGKYPMPNSNGRNIRNVWTIPSHPFPGAHFATFPPALVERCIKAGSSERGCCPTCGAPVIREMEYGKSSWEARKAAGHPTSGYHASDGAISSRDQVENNRAGGLGWVASKKFIGWIFSCNCPYEDPIPARILDPFAGSGTTGLVADRLGRDATLIDLNTSYIDMAVNSIRDDSPLFAEVAAE